MTDPRLDRVVGVVTHRGVVYLFTDAGRYRDFLDAIGRDFGMVAWVDRAVIDPDGCGTATRLDGDEEHLWETIADASKSST
jgi:hypothetical protein